MVALKRTQKAGTVISREYEILEMLKGATNVVQLLDFFYSKDGKNRLIQNTVMEFCNSSLEHVIRDHRTESMPMATIKTIIRQVFAGLQ
jgi:serine/threonine protein kinase